MTTLKSYFNSSGVTVTKKKQSDVFGGSSLLPLLPPKGTESAEMTSHSKNAGGSNSSSSSSSSKRQRDTKDTNVRQTWQPRPKMNTRAVEEEELDELQLSDSQMRVLEAIMQRKSIFYTGAAGTGKSFILKIVQQVFQYVKKANALSITATTGIAAVNVRGMTVHSWSGVGIGTGSLEETVARASRSKAVKKRWEETETLVIDEVSMLSAELFEKISAIGKRCRADPRPFGGLQVILCGDFMQLPPVGLGKDCHFCFHSPVWTELLGPPTAGGMMVLDKVFRQKDPRFLRVLNELRRGVCSAATDALLQSKVREAPRVRKEFAASGRNPTKLFAVNTLVDKINETELAKLASGESADGSPLSYLYKAKDEGDIGLMKSSRVPDTIELRVGAEVMLLKNLSTDEGLVNGSRGRVVRFESNLDFVEERYSVVPEHFPGNLRMFPVVEFFVVFGSTTEKVEKLVRPESWDVTQGQKVLAQRTQVPLILSWAMSIHKSQGMTIPLVEVSTDRSFEYGQVYVALSRAVSLEGLILTDFNRNTIKCHEEVRAFYQSMGVSAEEPEVEQDASVSTSVGHLANAFDIYLPEYQEPNDGWVENIKPSAPPPSKKLKTPLGANEYWDDNEYKPSHCRPVDGSAATAVARGELSLDELQSATCNSAPSKPTFASAAELTKAKATAQEINANPFATFVYLDPAQAVLGVAELPTTTAPNGTSASELSGEQKRRIEESKAKARAKLEANRLVQQQQGGGGGF